MKSEMSFTLQNGMIPTGTVHHIVQLSAKFQIWARQYGLSDEESLACWVANNDEYKITYFQSIEEADNIASIGFEKLKGIEIPNLTEIQ